MDDIPCHRNSRPGLDSRGETPRSSVGERLGVGRRIVEDWAYALRGDPATSTETAALARRGGLKPVRGSNNGNSLAWPDGSSSPPTFWLRFHELAESLHPYDIAQEGLLARVAFRAISDRCRQRAQEHTLAPQGLFDGDHCP
jgi:hypothetical protein